MESKTNVMESVLNQFNTQALVDSKESKIATTEERANEAAMEELCERLRITCDQAYSCRGEDRWFRPSCLTCGHYTVPVEIRYNSDREGLEVRHILYPEGPIVFYPTALDIGECSVVDCIFHGFVKII